MSTMGDEDTDDIHFEKMTLGLINTLEKRDGIVDIRLNDKGPCERHNIQQWEQKHSCMMPDDLRNFYQTNNGFSLTWSVKMNEARVIVGRLEINSLDNLVRIGGTSGGAGGNTPSVCDVDIDTSSESDGVSRPRFDHRSRIFELDPCDRYARVCLVYNNTKPGIPAQNADVWLLDRAFGWHRLTDSFLTYYRLMLTHMGLPQWQYSLTDLGLPPQSKQWFHMFAPLRVNSVPQESDSQSGNVTLDVGKVFRGKSDKRRTGSQLQGQKKKSATASIKSTASRGSAGSQQQFKPK